jgi:hypothetical protein
MHDALMEKVKQAQERAEKSEERNRQEAEKVKQREADQEEVRRRIGSGDLTPVTEAAKNAGVRDMIERYYGAAAASGAVITYDDARPGSSVGKWEVTGKFNAAGHNGAFTVTVESVDGLPQSKGTHFHK